MKYDEERVLVEYEICPKKKAHWDHFFAISPYRRRYTIFIYEVSPIDYWSSFQDFDDYVRDYDHSHPDDGYAYEEFMRKDIAMRLARDFGGWEGDINEGPFVCPDLDLDDLCSPSVNIVWKQSNNGVTFICSPKMLDRLQNELVCSLIETEIKSFGSDYGFKSHSKVST